MENTTIVTCTNCRMIFDNEQRKPKLLTCCRLHTLCLKCLRENVGKYITCPSCRRQTYGSADLTTYPDNVNVAYILTLKSKVDSDAAKKAKQKGPNWWCITCDSVSRPTCAGLDHTLLHLKANMIKNVEKLTDLQNECKFTKESLISAIEKRKEIAMHYKEMLQSIKTVEKDIQSQLEKNDRSLTEWTNFLKKIDPVPTPSTKDEAPLSELAAFATISGSEVKLEKIVKEYSQDYNRKLIDVNAEVSDIFETKKMKISVHLSDPLNKNEVPIGNLLSSGFIPEGLDKNKKLGPVEKASLALLSYVVFILRKHKDT